MLADTFGFPPAVKIGIAIAEALENVVTGGDRVSGHLFNQRQSYRQCLESGFKPLQCVRDDEDTIR